MKKSWLGLVIAVVIMMSGQGVFAEDQIQGFANSKINPDTDFGIYDDICVEKLNLQEVNLDDSGLLEEEEEKDNLEYEYRMIIGKTLEKVIPVTYRQTDKKNKREMVLLVKLEGALKETRLIENLLPGAENRRAKVTIEGHLVDMATREELAYFYDEYTAKKRGEDASIFDSDDIEQWNKAVTLWAKYLANFLVQKRGDLYVFSR